MPGSCTVAALCSVQGNEISWVDGPQQNLDESFPLFRLRNGHLGESGPIEAVLVPCCALNGCLLYHEHTEAEQHLKVSLRVGRLVR